MLEDIGLEFEEDQLLTGARSSYLQRNSINGFSILIPRTYVKPPAQFLKALGIKRQVSIKSAVFFWTPPAVVVFLKKMIRDWIPRLIKIGKN